MENKNERDVIVRLDRIDVGLDRVDVRLDRVDVRLDRVDVRLDRVDSDVAELKADVRELKTAVTGLDKRLVRVEILHEETDDKIQLVFEAQVATNERLDRMESRFLGEFRAIRSDIQLFVQAETKAHEEFRRRFDDHEGRIGTLEARHPPGQ